MVSVYVWFGVDKKGLSGYLDGAFDMGRPSM